MAHPSPQAPPARGASRPVWLAALLATVACVAVTVALFGRAYPMVDAGLRLTRAEALSRARALAASERLAPAGARAAARFETNDTLSTYVDLAAGGADSLRAIIADSGHRGGVPVYSWAVRLFEPGSPREALVRFAPDGRVVGVERRLAQDDPRPTVTEAAGRLAADSALARWGRRDPAGFRLVSSSYETQPRSGRVDRTYVYERLDAARRPVRIGEAPVRVAVTVTGDSLAAGGRVGDAPGAADSAARAVPLAVAERAEIPEAFLRRYAEMRSANDLWAALTLPGMGVFFVAAVVGVVRLRARGALRVRPAAAVGALVGAFVMASGLNEIPVAWFDYDTATAPSTFVAQLVVFAVLGGAAAGVFVAFTVAAAEGLTRLAFPEHHDWYAFWRHRGAPAVAGRVLAGYALAAFGFAYVTLFYLAARTTLGWWVPTGTLDDPNQIATPLPWVPAIGLALFAGIWEEAIFRAVPLAALALWARGRQNERAWMAAGVVVTALVFGFGHANYPSWPPYSRGVELFLEAALWAVVYLRFGLPTTIVAHVLYDLAWFGLFALSGTDAAYRVTAAVVVLAFLFPALAVAQGWLARRRAAGAALVDDAPRMASFTPPPADAPAEPAPPPPPRAAFDPRRRVAAVAVGAVGLAAHALLPARASLGPEFTAPRARVTAAADSALRAWGADPAAWRRLVAARAGPSGIARRFLVQSLGHDRAVERAQALAATYLPAAWWDVRYVRTAGPVAARAEEWRVRVLPDGRVLDVRHPVPEGRPGASPTPDSARAVLRQALATAGVSQGGLREVELRQTPRPRRLDTRIELEDPAPALPDAASARVRVSLAGADAIAVTRAVELPERFQRAERERASRRTLATALGAVGAAGLVLALIVAATRRPEHPHARRLLDRRAAFALGAGATLAAIAPQLNAFSETLADWDTAAPWTTYLAQAAISVAIGAAAVGAAAAALWLTADALRRRTSIPFWPEPGAARDALAAGAALGAGSGLATLVLERLRPSAWPAPPSTALDQIAPVLGGALGVIGGVVLQPAVAILPLALAVGARSWRVRIALLALAAAFLAPVVRGDGGLVEAGAVVAAQLAVMTILVRLFGAHSGIAWVFAALVGALCGALRSAHAAGNGTDTLSTLLGAATAAAVIAVVYRVADRTAAERSAADVA